MFLSFCCYLTESWNSCRKLFSLYIFLALAHAQFLLLYFISLLYLLQWIQFLYLIPLPDTKNQLIRNSIFLHQFYIKSIWLTFFFVVVFLKRWFCKLIMLLYIGRLISFYHCRIIHHYTFHISVKNSIN